MGKEKFRDEYESFCKNPQEFFNELHERQENTKIYEVSTEDFTFYFGTMDGNDLVLTRLEGEDVLTTRMLVTDEQKDVLCDDECLRIGLYVQIPDESGDMGCLPVSQNCKLSLGNRSSLTFNGDFNTTINKVALARMYEDLIPRETKKGKIQIITVYGKAQAMMTNVYSSVSHESYFDKVNSMVKKRFGEAAELKSGYISQKWTRATWYIGEFKSEKDSTQTVKLGITAMDSQTGYSGAVLQPCIFSGKTSHEMFFDETWYAKHMAFSDKDIDEALEAVYLTLNDNAQKLIDTINLDLKFPAGYARRICEELNKLAVKTKSVKMSAKSINEFVQSIQGLSFIRSNMTAWDIIELLWEIPNKSKASEAHKDGLMKTVSRVLALNHAAFDAA